MSVIKYKNAKIRKSEIRKTKKTHSKIVLA